MGFLAFILAGTDFYAHAQERAKVYQGTIIRSNTIVRSTPRSDGKVLVSLKVGDSVNVLSQSRYWYRLQLKTRSGRSREGWVQKTSVRLKAPMAAAGQKPKASETKVPESQGANRKGRRLRSERKHGYRLFSGPVFSIYRFGATQVRMGGAYDYFLSDTVKLSIPVSYSFGSGGFSSLQGGFESSFRMVKWTKLSLYSRGAALFERFSGNGRSFIAGTVDLGMGIVIPYRSSMYFTVEPISLEISPIASNDVSWFVRGQVLVSFGGRF